MIKSLTRCRDLGIHFPNSSETSIEPFNISKVFASVNGSETVSSQILTGQDTLLGRIRQANFSHSWQNPCSPSGYDPDRCPKWIPTGSVINVSKEDLELFQKNPEEDPDWSGSNLESRNGKDFEQDRDLIRLGSCSIRIVAEPFRVSPGVIRNEIIGYPVFNSYEEILLRHSVRDLDLHTSKVDLVFNETIGYKEIFIVSHWCSGFTWDENKYLY